MKTAVLVISHPRVNKTVARHFPHYVKSGGDVIGVCDRGTGCVWPDGTLKVLEFDEIHDQRTKLLKRFFEVLQWCVDEGASLGYERFVLCEYDVCFVRPIPEQLHDQMVATRVGEKSQGFHGKFYYHCPWIFSLYAVKQFLHYGKRMVEAGIDEGGFIDRFLGLYDDLFGPVIDPAQNFSRNTIDRPEYVRDAQAAVKNPGCFAVHGIKTAEQLRDVVSALPENQNLV